MILRFELTMPNVGSWNGADAGSKAGLFIFRNLPKKRAEILDGDSFYYNFGDGWGANVFCKIARRSKSAGFRGYDWMVNEIIQHGRILTLQERRKK